MSTDWNAWHEGYDDPASNLSRRRRSVQQQIRAWLDERPEPALRVVSACAGDGRDLLGVLAGRPDAGRVSAVLLELDVDLADRARAYVDSHRLTVMVRVADAGAAATYRGAVPADLVLMCGVFGNMTDDDLRATVSALPSLCTPGATVIWTRGALGSGDPTDTIRSWFAESGFEEVAFDRPTDASYRVGAHRLVRDPKPLDPSATFFTFTR